MQLPDLHVHVAEELSSGGPLEGGALHLSVRIIDSCFVSFEFALLDQASLSQYCHKALSFEMVSPGRSSGLPIFWTLSVSGALDLGPHDTELAGSAS